jgi:glycine/D-amino acid oxidase-like deaminating enzyme
VFYNTGHGHLGWTLSAATAHIVGDAVTAGLRGLAPVSVGAFAGRALPHAR